MDTKDVLLTKEGLQKLQDEYNELVNVRRPQVIETIQKTREMGDLSENGGYQAAVEEQSFIDKRIEQLEEILKNAKVADAKATDKVSFGSTVTLKDLEKGDVVTYSLVGSTEANPAEGRVSYESPLGKSLLNKKINDEVIVETPVGKLRYQVTNIE